MDILSTFIEWFKSLSTIGVIVVIGIGIYIFHQVKKVIFRILSVVLGLIGLTKFYLMF